MLKAIEIAETFVVPLSLSYKKSLINYYCGDINYYQYNFYQGIRRSFISVSLVEDCNNGLRCIPELAGLYSLRGRIYHRMNRLFYVWNKNSIMK